MLNLTTRYPIGIDIGAQDIYAAQLKDTKRGLKIRGLAHRQVAEGTVDASGVNESLLTSLKAVSKDNRFSGRRVVLRIPPQFVFSFPLRFQLNAGEDLEEAILRESRDYLPFPMDEAVIDYPSIVSQSLEGVTEYKTTIAAVRRDYIETYLLVLKKAGFIVEAVDFGVSALIRLHTYLHDPGQTPIILCNIGSRQSLLAVVTSDNIIAQIDINWGLENLLRTVLANLNVTGSEDRARIFLQKYGLLYEDRLQTQAKDATEEPGLEEDTLRVMYQIITPYVEELVYEFHKFIGYVRSEENNVVFDGIFLYGQAAFVRDLERYLEKRLRIPTRFVDIFMKADTPDTISQTEALERIPFALALGLAMRKVTWL